MAEHAKIGYMQTGLLYARNLEREETLQRGVGDSKRFVTFAQMLSPKIKCISSKLERCYYVEHNASFFLNETSIGIAGESQKDNPHLVGA